MNLREMARQCGAVCPEPLRLVRQHHKFGCAYAAHAMLAGTTYEEALRKLAPERKAGDPVRLLSALQAVEPLLDRFEVAPDGPLARLKKHALAVVYVGDLNRANGLAHDMHAVVWDAARGAILDPAHGICKNVRWYQSRLVVCVALTERVLYEKRAP